MLIELLKILQKSYSSYFKHRNISMFVGTFDGKNKVNYTLKTFCYRLFDVSVVLCFHFILDLFSGEQ